MKITQRQLRQIIREELEHSMRETPGLNHRFSNRPSYEPNEDQYEDLMQGDLDDFADTGEDPYPFGFPVAMDDEPIMVGRRGARRGHLN